MIGLDLSIKGRQEVQETQRDTKTSHSTDNETTYTRTPVMHTAQDCLIYGHDWQTTGINGQKQCGACGTIGYCPVCTPHQSQNAQPFFCTQHTPQVESQVRA
jgi:hypothetical protein